MEENLLSIIAKVLYYIISEESAGDSLLSIMALKKKTFSCRRVFFLDCLTLPLIASFVNSVLTTTQLRVFVTYCPNHSGRIKKWTSLFERNTYNERR